MTRRRNAFVRMVAAAVSVAALAAGCGGGGAEGPGDGPSSVPAVAADPQVQALLPEAVRERGVLRVATMNNYKPFSFNDAGTQTGMIPDMSTAVAETMGLRIEVNAVDFGSILTGLQAGRYDIGMGEFFVRPDRLEVADFVTEWSNSDAFIVADTSDYRPDGLPDTCGQRIAILTGSSGVPAMERGAEVCTEAGQPAPEVQTFPAMNDAVLALTSDRVDAVLTGREVGVVLEQDGVPVTSSGQVSGGPTATAVSRAPDVEGLPEAIQAAYESLIANGTYEAIHQKWGTDYGVIDDPAIYRAGDTPPVYEEQ
ncbi:transporter substrate-binding domain-containing protein [Pseudonocardia nematodicida]|uniref:Transporter substrate-binding domain-containing protein n=1 Tax=Pseudonocardia nematodicida TaxID=1206997 RepID=A0ABV1KGI8_9PSEU